jgi:predicted nucleotidyltransferase component of viral defense system
MPGFEELVNDIMQQPGLSAMRPVVEKEILHYDIFQALDQAKLLKNLVFQGGTSLRLCRGSNRFSEDLNFAGGVEFNAAMLGNMKEAIESYIGGRYGLLVKVKEPTEHIFRNESANIWVDHWQVSVETAPARRDLPKQKIKIQVANVPAYTSELLPLKINYPQLQGYGGVIFTRTETINEVLADKVLAFPASIKYIRHRDIWDIAWLIQQGAKPDTDMVKWKVADYKTQNYENLVREAIAHLPKITNSKEFLQQMRRFIDAQTFERTLAKDEFLGYLIDTVVTVFEEMLASFFTVNTDEQRKKTSFRM